MNDDDFLKNIGNIKIRIQPIDFKGLAYNKYAYYTDGSKYDSKYPGAIDAMMEAVSQSITYKKKLDSIPFDIIEKYVRRKKLENISKNE